MDGFTAKDTIILELSAGTGGVTASFKRHGFTNSVAVDKTKTAGALTGIIPLDLTKDEDQKAVFQWMQHPAVKGVFLAPPCGTASAARNIDLPGEDAPPPLRSLEEPDGIAGLTGVNLKRVSAANILYAFCAEVLELCCMLEKLFMLENPRNSLFWFTTAWKESPCAHCLYFSEHQACGYGGKRPKWTRLAANFEQVATINAVCPQNHHHEPWGLVKTGSSKRVFATSLEVHYPKLLCEAIVHAFILCLTEKGLQFTDTPKAQHAARAATLEQSKSLKLPPLVPNFSSKLVLIYNNDVVVWPLQTVDLSPCKLLHEFIVGNEVEVKQLTSNAELKRRVEVELEVWGINLCLDDFHAFEFKWNKMKIFGVQWSPTEFLDLACKVQHPLNPSLSLPSVLANAIEFQTSHDLHEVAKLRAEFFLFWNAKASELTEAENLLRQQMDETVETAVKGKRIALFEEMLKHYEYPDLGVIDELKFGASLTGEVQETDMLPFKFTPAVLTCDALEFHSALRREQVLSEPRGSGDCEIDTEVWRQTLEETNLGWLRGPLPLSEVPETAPISRRFGLRQKHKIRLIDDFSESSVNSTVAVYESPVLHTVDVACAAIMHWFACTHTTGMDPTLVARTFDLASAYRQVGLNESGRKVAFIRVYNPEKKCWSIFQALVLPFGAIKSVHAFLRLARAIWWLGVVGCKLFWSSFFDDYIVFSAPLLARSSELTAIALFKLLGWIFAEDGRKFKPFSSCCEALGVIFDLSDSKNFICKITNTASRIDEISAEIQRLLDAGAITQVEAQKLRGRMQFAESQLFGRTGKRCVACLKDFSCRRRSRISDRDATFLKLFLSLLKSEDPRTISLQPSCSVVVITDACYERDSRYWICGLGGVLVDTTNNTKLFFSCQLNEEQRVLLGELQKKQIIFEAETLCALLAYCLWTDLFAGRLSFLYVDNEGTKFSLMKGSSENVTVDAMAQVFIEVETHVRTLCWLARVGSFSNIADGPSRGDCNVLKELKFIDVSEEASRCLNNVCMFISEKLGKTAGHAVPRSKKNVLLPL